MPVAVPAARSAVTPRDRRATLSKRCRPQLSFPGAAVVPASPSPLLVPRALNCHCRPCPGSCRRRPGPRARRCRPRRAGRCVRRRRRGVRERRAAHALDAVERSPAASPAGLIEAGRGRPTTPVGEPADSSGIEPVCCRTVRRRPCRPRARRCRRTRSGCRCRRARVDLVGGRGSLELGSLPSVPVTMAMVCSSPA